MAMIYQVHELASWGIPSGRFRFIGISDEDSNTVHELCQCEGGHSTQDEARNCPIAKLEYDKVFKKMMH